MKKLHRKLTDQVPPNSNFSTIYRPSVGWKERYKELFSRLKKWLKNVIK